MSAHVLLVEDDNIVLDLLSAFLGQAGLRVTGAASAAAALASFDAAKPDIIVMDLGLPDDDGLVLIRKFQAVSDVPVIVLSARTENEHRLAALELGASDYLTKGIDPQELLIRIGNILERDTSRTGAHVPQSPPEQDSVIQFADWTLNIDGHELRDPEGTPVKLTHSEFLVLAALAKRPGRVVTRDGLLDAVSGLDEAPLDRTIDTYISRLRKKIERDPKTPQIIQTLKGVGYKLNA